MYRNIFSLFIISVLSVSFANSSKILFLSCTPAPSHQKPFQALWKTLSQRGHEVHVLTPNPLNDSNLTNLTEYDLSEYYEILSKYSSGTMNYFLQKPSFFTVFAKDAFITKIFSDLYNRTINHAEMQRILENNKHFDVVIAEWLFPTLGAVAAYYDAPLIGITSLGAPVPALDTLGNPSHPIVAPDMNLPLHRDLSFKERLLSSIYAVYVRLHYRYVVLPREDVNIKKHLRSDLPYIGDIENSISVLLMNRNPVFHRAIPLLPSTVELGGIHIEAEKVPFDQELKAFLDSSLNGVIYFSLGSSMRSALLEPSTIHQLQEVFKQLSYNVIWKWEEDVMDGKPDNVFISKWIPQISLLEHPNVKLFITQGGLQSIEEAIAAHKPIIGIPFHSDQTTNVDTCVQYGMGKMMDLDELTEETLRSYILEVIENPSYTENAKKLDELMKDQPQDGIDKAIWWIEYVIRHKGAKHLRSIAVDLPWWQYLMLDVLGFIFAVLLSVLTLLYLLVRAIVKIFSKMFCSKKEKAKAKKKKLIKNE